MRTPPNSNVTSTATCVVSFCCTTFLLSSVEKQQHHVELCMMSLLTSIEATCSYTYITQQRNANAVDCFRYLAAGSRSMSKRFAEQKQLKSRAERADFRRNLRYYHIPTIVLQTERSKEQQHHWNSDITRLIFKSKLRRSLELDLNSA